MLYNLVVIWLVLSIICTVILFIKYYRENLYGKTTRITCPKCGYKNIIRLFRKDGK